MKRKRGFARARATEPDPKPKTREMITLAIPKPLQLVPQVNGTDGKPMVMLFADFVYVLGTTTPHFAGSFSGMCALKKLTADLHADEGTSVAVPADDLRAIARKAIAPGPSGYPVSHVAIDGPGGKPKTIKQRILFEDLHDTIATLIAASGIELPTDEQAQEAAE